MRMTADAFLMKNAKAVRFHALLIIGKMKGEFK